jgi:SAM-dependent methyltransferase
MSEIDFGTTASGLHGKVVEVFINEPKGKLLDAPSGVGELSYLLQKEGFDVTAGDIEPQSIRADNVIKQKLDLNATLPFDDESFDYVINVEGLEHLENPHATIREFTRILKSGGKCVFTTPNVLNVFSRLRYLLIGYHEYFGDYFANEENFYVLHINPVGLPEIDFALRQNGLEIEEITSNRDVRATKGFLTRIILNILMGVVRFITNRKVSDQRMRNLLLSDPVLTGQIIIIKCRKV